MDNFKKSLVLYATISKYLLEREKHRPKVPKNYAISMVVEKFVQLLGNGYLPELRNHYDAQFARVAP